MKLHATETMIGDTPVVTIDGVVDLAAVGTLYDHLVASIRRHRGMLVLVDLDAVSTLDDSGLGVLLGAAATARDLGGELELVCSNETLRERLAQTRLDRAITIRPSVAHSRT